VDKFPFVPHRCAGRRVREHGQLRRRRGIDRNGTGHQVAHTRIVRRDRNRRRNPLRLAESFIVSEDESFVLDDWPTRRAAELIAPELRQWGVAAPGEVISRIQRTVPYEFVNVAMEGVRADLVMAFTTPPVPSHTRPRTPGQNGELLNGVHTQGSADHVARAAVGVIVDANTVQP